MKGIIGYSVCAEEYENLVNTCHRFNELCKLINANSPNFVTVTMIAKANGLTRQEVWNRPWMIPHYGKTNYESSGKRTKQAWNYEEYLDWISIPEIERIVEYRNLKKR